MTTGADDFNRADGPLGANWASFNEHGFGDMTVVANAAEGGFHTFALWVDPADTTDQFAQVEWDTSTGEVYGPIVCADTAWQTGYYLFCATWFDGHVELHRNGTSVATDDGASWAATETLRIEKNGDTVSVFRGAVEVITYVDPAPLTGTRFGFGAADQNEGQPRQDNFTGGDLAPPASVPGAPTNLDALPENGQASLSWDAPVDDGGSPITDYVVQYRPTWPSAHDIDNPVRRWPFTETSGDPVDAIVGEVGRASVAPNEPVRPSPGAPETGNAIGFTNNGTTLQWADIGYFDTVGDGDDDLVTFSFLLSTTSSELGDLWGGGDFTDPSDANVNLYEINGSSILGPNVGRLSGFFGRFDMVNFVDNNGVMWECESPTVNWRDGAMHHHMVTYNRTAREMHFYLDGIEQTVTLLSDSAVWMSPGPWPDIYLGQAGNPSGGDGGRPGQPQGSAGATGVIDEFAVFADTLTQADAERIHQAAMGEWTTFPDVVSTDTTAIVTGLLNGVTYEFRVAAVNAEGQGPWSTIVQATPLDDVQGAGVTNYAWETSGVGQAPDIPPSEGAGATAYAWTTAGEGLAPAEGAGATTYEWITTGTAETGRTGSGAASYEWITSGVGDAPDVPPAEGSGAVEYAWTTSAQGSAPDVLPATGNGTVEYAWSVAGEGLAERVGFGVVNYAWVLFASGGSQSFGTGSTSYAWATSGVGESEHQGAGSVIHEWITAASGSAPDVLPHSGSGLVTYAWTTSAQGEAPAVLPSTGSGTTSYAWETSATGEAPAHLPRGTGSTSYSWDVAGTGARASLGSGSVTYRWTVVGVGGREVVLPADLLNALVELTQCVCAELSGNGVGEPCWCGLMPGASVSWDYCTDCGDGRCGTGWVRVVDVFPYEVFPTPSSGINCRSPLAVQLEIGAVRCMPVTADGELLDPSESTETALMQLADTFALWRAIECCQSATISLGTYTPAGPEGACVGGVWTAFMAVD